MPVHNEAAIIERTLVGLQGLRNLGAEVIVVDGASRGSTASIADPHCGQLLSKSAGRARQLQAGIGEQGIFAQRGLLERIGGIPALPLMEDIELSKRLRRQARPLIARPTLITSSRRWYQRGVGRTVLEMWTLRAAYTLGVSPARIADYYQRRAPRG